MQPITTKYHGPTNTRPSRIIARAAGQSVTMSPDDSTRMLHEDIHAAAAKAVAQKLGWKGEWVGSQLDRYWVWVPTDARNTDRFTA
jgi:hypothetical protein